MLCQVCVADVIGPLAFYANSFTAYLRQTMGEQKLRNCETLANNGAALFSFDQHHSREDIHVKRKQMLETRPRKVFDCPLHFGFLNRNKPLGVKFLLNEKYLNFMFAKPYPRHFRLQTHSFYYYFLNDA